MKRLRVSLILTSFVFLLSSCGGSGGDQAMVAPLPPPAAPEPTPEPPPIVAASGTQQSRFDPVNGLELNEAFIEGFIAAIGGPVDYSDSPQELRRWRRPAVIKYAPSLALPSHDKCDMTTG